MTASAEVSPGNIYPAKGGRRTPGTDFWLVVATSERGCHCLGLNAAGEPVSTASYTKSAMRERPVVARVDLSALVLRPVLPVAVKPLESCASDCDGDCTHPQCPQLRDGEPHKSGRHCPLDKRTR